jgi:hypothetical protein
VGGVGFSCRTSALLVEVSASKMLAIPTSFSISRSKLPSCVSATKRPRALSIPSIRSASLRPSSIRSTRSTEASVSLRLTMLTCWRGSRTSIRVPSASAGGSAGRAMGSPRSDRQSASPLEPLPWAGGSAPDRSFMLYSPNSVIPNPFAFEQFLADYRRAKELFACAQMPKVLLDRQHALLTGTLVRLPESRE